MANIWEYIATYNPSGFYEDNRAKSLRNDFMNVKISAANRENAREAKIMALQDALNNGDKSALRSLGIYSPETTKKYIENEQEMLDTVRPMAQAILKMAPENRAKGYEQMLNALPYYRVDGSDMPRQYDEQMVEFLANSDKMKLQQERQYALQDELANKNQAREFARLRYAKQMQEEELQNQVSRIQAGIAAGEISEQEGQNRINALKYGVKEKGMLDTLNEEYFNPNTAPERRQEILEQVAALKQANMGGSIAADVQKMAAYERAKEREEQRLGRELTSEEDMRLRSNYGIKGNDITKDINSSKADDQIRVNNSKAQNAIDLENVKQGNRITMADVNAENDRKLEDLKQKNRIGLAYVNDKISAGKELRELNNKKSLEDFKNKLPTKDALELMRLADYMTKQGRPTTYEELAAQQYEDALAAAELDKQYKQAQIDKLTEETLNAGKTGDIKNFEYLQEQGFSNEDAANKAFGSKGTTVNVGGGEPEFTKQMAKQDATDVSTAEKEAAELGNQLFILDEALSAINDENLYQGTGGDVVNTLRTALASMGIEIKGLDSGQILNQASSMLKGRLRKDLMPGPLSDRDLAFLIAMTPSLDKTDIQNAAIINMYRKMCRRQKELLDFKAKYGRENRSLSGWQEAAREAGLDKPIFSETDKALAMGESVKQQQNKFSNATDDEIFGVLGGF